MQAFYLDTVESTNDLARAMVSDGRIRDRAYIVSREQTAGRGNRGRTWISPKDAGIYLSVVDRPDLIPGGELHAFTRAAGIAAAEALRQCANVAVRLKPINDLYFDGRKLGGILTEAVIERHQLRALITGIGINVRRVERPVPAGHVEPICLEEIVPDVGFTTLDQGTLTSLLVDGILRWNKVVGERNHSELEAQWSRYCLNGQPGPSEEASPAFLDESR